MCDTGLYLHRVADFGHGAGRNSAGSAAAIFDDIVQMRGVLGQRGAGVPHGREAFDHRSATNFLQSIQPMAAVRQSRLTCSMTGSGENIL